MLTIAFTNQKGGVGKTSTVVGLASTLDRRGMRVLCVDLDPAGHVIAARVQYVAEMVVREVVAPVLTRTVHPGSAGLPILAF